MQSIGTIRFVLLKSRIAINLKHITNYASIHRKMILRLHQELNKHISVEKKGIFLQSSNTVNLTLNSFCFNFFLSASILKS